MNGDLNDIRNKTNNNRMYELHVLIKEKYNIEISTYDLSVFLKKCMNHNADMQTWLFENKARGRKLSDLDLYEKFFSLNTNEEILALYDKEPNKHDSYIYKSRIRRR